MRPRDLGRPIRTLKLSGDTASSLFERGIATEAQLADLLRRLPSKQARRLVGGDPAALLRTLRSVRPPTFRVPPVTGIPGPARALSRVRKQRLLTRAARRRLIRYLEYIEPMLPTRFLHTGWVTRPPMDQGIFPYCVGCAVASAREHLAQHVLSPLMTYGVAKSLDEHPELDGTWQRFAMEGLATVGTVFEKQYPYSSAPYDPEIVQHLGSKADRFKVASYTDVLLEDEDLEWQPTLIKAVSCGAMHPDIGPRTVPVSLALYSNITDPVAVDAGLWSIPDLQRDTLLGGHAMDVQGFVDARDPDALFSTTYFVVRNSWGRYFAPNNLLGLPGYALVPAGYFQQSELLWEAFAVEAEPSPVPGRRRATDTPTRTWAGWTPVNRG